MAHTEHQALARVGFDAYGQHTRGLTYDGQPLPAFDDLGPTVQGAWAAAAAAILTHSSSDQAPERVTP